MWTPVVDLSRWQGDVDFGVMRGRGVAGVIIRATHGRTKDTLLAQHVAGRDETRQTFLAAADLAAQLETPLVAGREHL